MTAAITLRDHLAHLQYPEVRKLLGPETARRLAAGGKWEVDIPSQVRLADGQFVLTLPGATVTLRYAPDTPGCLHWECSACTALCDHVGAAFALILDDKTALGLAAPPPETPVGTDLDEAALVRQALAARAERAKTEKMSVSPVRPGVLWADYLVTNRGSGKTWRVAFRGWERGESYCACADFRTNTLGTCKHLLRVADWARRRFPAAVCRRPYRPERFAVHLRYGAHVELHLQTPAALAPGLAAVVAPLAGQPITDVPALLQAVRELEAREQPVTVFPDAEEHIQQRLFAAHMRDKMAEIRRDPVNHPLRRELLKAELLPYQLDGVAFAAGAGRAVLADDMGLGKTIQGIGVAELLALEAGIKRVLIVCPVSLKAQWRSEIERFAWHACQLVAGGARERAAQYAADCFYTICNYEQVLRDLALVERQPWDLIVLDEGQRIKNWEAKTTRVIKGLRSRFALVLSGTPLENRLDELYTVVGFIDPRRLGPAFRFFAAFRETNERGRVLGYKRLDRLRELLRPIMLRRTRAMVMKDLPPRSTEIVRIEPTQEQLDIHVTHMRVVSQIVRKRFISEMDLLRLQKALLMCRMTANGTFLVDKQYPGYSTKLEQLRSLLGELVAEDDRKILLFSEWTTMLDAIEPILKELRAPFVRLDGSVPQKLRPGLVHEFQTNPACKLFITTNAGSTGLNLQAANTVVNVDLPWNPAVLEQRVARAHRMGQKRPVQVYLLVTEQTIEENLLGTLSAKHELALAVLDPESKVNAVDLASGVEELKRRLEVLLGQKPAAPVDESARAHQTAEAERMAHRAQVAEAGGRFVSAAFGFLGELLPRQAPTPEAERAAAAIRDRLAACLEPDADGRLRLSVTLPDAQALNQLAGSLAQLLALSGTGAGAAIAGTPRPPSAN